MNYIALLRGINVSGQKSIKMADLIKLFESLGFRNVRTYVQSGNVLFESDSVNMDEMVKKIENKINEVFGFMVVVIIRSSEELKKIITGNPLIREPGIDVEKLHVTFLRELPDKKVLSTADIKKEENEKFAISGREVYIYCPNGYGRTNLNNATFEKKLKTIATTRNWKTTNKLYELLNLAP
jgi:uncharacterized protein (DUF1697 family)